MYQIPRGTRDFTSKEMQKRRFIENNIRSTFINFGYREVQTPTFENLELFTAKSGETIIDEIYSFKDKGGRDLALRPELTAPVIRFYVEKLQMEPKPLKLFYFGSCYRYDRPQKGRYREFTQAGCELIGTDTTEAYAELIAMAFTILKNLGLKNIKLNIGNLKILSFMFKKINLSKVQQKYLTPLIDKQIYEEVMEALVDFNLNNKDASEFIDILTTSDIKKIKKYIGEDEEAVKELDELEKIFKLLRESFNIKESNLKMSIVRGLDYYTGVVFEIEAPNLGAESQLCGGGAYDLAELFGGKETPTSGFAIGFDRTILALETEKKDFPKIKLDVYIIPFNEDMISKSVEICQSLRKQGFSVDMDLLQRGIGKSLKYASSINAERVIIIGPDEIKKDSVTIKDMVSGNQSLVKIKDISKSLQK